MLKPFASFYGSAGGDGVDSLQKSNLLQIWYNAL